MKSILNMNKEMMATTARVEVTQKIIELVDFPVESVGEESINWNKEWSGRFSEAKRLYSEFTSTYNEPLLQYHPIPQAYLPATVVNGGSTPAPPKEQSNLVEKSDQIEDNNENRNGRSDCLNELKPLLTSNAVKRRRTRKLSDIHKECDTVVAAAVAAKELDRADRTCKADDDAIKIESEKCSNNNAKKKKHNKKKKNKMGKKCSYCESTRTPQWREGPAGPNTLCNACGLRLKKWNCLDPSKINQLG